jgi:3-isopropylmalate/(R)-2-methylmalate dehydratase small subunit
VAKYEDLRAGDDALLAATGQAWVFGDQVSQRQLLADECLGQHASVAKANVLVALDPQFASNVAAGDLLVGGLEFGTDVTQRSVVSAVRALGIAAVIARSFGPFFLRTALHIGLPALVVEETAAIRSGDHLRVDIEAHVVANLSSGDRYVIRNIDDTALAVLRRRSDQ